MAKQSNHYLIAEYKNKIMNLLVKNKDFVKLMNPTPSECEDIDEVDVLMGGRWVIDGEEYTEQGQVFDYVFVDDTTTDKKPFVCVEAIITTIDENAFVYFNLYVYVFCEKTIIRLDGYTSPTVEEVKDMGYYTGNVGNRVDVLCDIIDGILNGSEELRSLGTVNPAPTYHTELFTTTNNKYYGKTLRYQVMNYNTGGDNCE